MANLDYSAAWGKNYNPSPFGDLLSLYRNGEMFSAGSPAATKQPSQPATFTPPPGVDPTAAYLINRQNPSAEEMEAAAELGFKRTTRGLDYNAKLQRESADYAQKLGKESAREALLLSSISKIGPMLSTALGGPSWDTIERNRETGLNAINNIKQSTLQPLSTAQFQPRSYYS